MGRMLSAAVDHVCLLAYTTPFVSGCYQANAHHDRLSRRKENNKEKKKPETKKAIVARR